MARVENSHTKALQYFYNVYQFIAPLAFFPIAYWLWWRRFGRNHELALLVMFVPVVSYYLFVGVGMFKYRLWRFNTSPTIAGMRPHHGFVFSTAAAMFFYICLRMVPVDHVGAGSIVTSAFLGASVFGFWNWWYETYAIKSGFISIYTEGCGRCDGRGSGYRLRTVFFWWHGRVLWRIRQNGREPVANRA